MAESNPLLDGLLGGDIYGGGGGLLGGGYSSTGFDNLITAARKAADAYDAALQTDKIHP